MSKQNYIIVDGVKQPFPPIATPDPSLSKIRELLRGYDQPDTILPNSALITDSNSKISQLTIVGNLSLNGAGDDAINSLGKINQIDCGFFDEE
jgi:hypothetical protein